VPQHPLPQPLQACPHIHAAGLLLGRPMGFAFLKRRADVKGKYISGLLPHAQVGHDQVAVIGLDFEEAIGKPRQTLELRVLLVLCRQRTASRIGHKAHGSFAIQERIEALMETLTVERYHAPQQGVKRRRCDQQLLTWKPLRLQRRAGVLRHPSLP
jgi:hypothetical protein